MPCGGNEYWRVGDWRTVCKRVPGQGEAPRSRAVSCSLCTVLWGADHGSSSPAQLSGSPSDPEVHSGRFQTIQRQEVLFPSLSHVCVCVCVCVRVCVHVVRILYNVSSTLLNF